MKLMEPAKGCDPFGEPELAVFGTLLRVLTDRRMVHDGFERSGAAPVSSVRRLVLRHTARAAAHRS